MQPLDRARPPLTCQHVHAFGGFLLRLHSAGTHEVLLQLVSLVNVLFIVYFSSCFIYVVSLDDKCLFKKATESS